MSKGSRRGPSFCAFYATASALRAKSIFFKLSNEISSYSSKRFDLACPTNYPNLEEGYKRNPIEMILFENHENCVSVGLGYVRRHLRLP